MTAWDRVGVDRVARVGSHVLIWAIVFVPTFMELFRGWRPLIGDDATITLRSFEILSLHPPLLGQYSTVSGGSGHILFDPGPLQYVLLTLPIHIDHLQGGLWGSALIYAVVLSLAVEAMWSVGRWLACVLVALAVVDLAWTVPSVFGHQIWNPDFGLPFLLASIVLAWAVALGSFGWWPVLVFTASVAAQTELFYATVAAGLVIVCPFLGLWHSGRPTRFRWLMVGAGVGVLCWLPSVIQEFSGSPGNLGALASTRREASLGIAYGLRSLGRLVWPTPLPVSQYTTDSYFSVGTVPVVCGVVVLASIAFIAMTAWRYGRKDLGALAAIGLTCSVCVVVAFASVPAAHVESLLWLMPILWVVAYIWWLIVIWAVIEAVRARRFQKSSLWDRPSPAMSFGVLVGVLLLLGLVGVWRLPSQSSVNSVESAQVSKVVRTVVHKIRPGTITVKFWPRPSVFSVSTEDYVAYQYGQAILWQLTAAGFKPLMPPFFTVLSAITYPSDPFAPKVNVIMKDQGGNSQIQKVVLGTYRPRGSRPVSVPLQTKVIVPSNGTTVRGSRVTLDASTAGTNDITSVRFVVTSALLSNHVVGNAALTLDGWITNWNTITVPNGSYTLQSIATERGGMTAISPGIVVTVDNQAP